MWRDGVTTWLRDLKEHNKNDSEYHSSSTIWIFFRKVRVTWENQEIVHLTFQRIFKYTYATYKTQIAVQRLQNLPTVYNIL